MYYCKSRYYAPELCRFISLDDIEYLVPESVNGLNLYCYCLNNPIYYCDPSGHFPWLILAAVMLFTPVGGTITQEAVSTLGYVEQPVGHWKIWFLMKEEKPGPTCVV